MDENNVWAPLAEGLPPKIYVPGQLIYLQDTYPAAFYYLESGSARSFISSPEGAERLLTLHHSGDLMGEASFFDQCPRVSSAIAITECKVFSIDRQRLERIFQLHPELALPMLRYLARTVRLLSGHVDDITFRPADQRLAGALLGQAREDGVVRATHEELGSAVGVSRVTVSRVLARFSQNGWIRTGYGAVTVMDKIALDRFSQDGV